MKEKKVFLETMLNSIIIIEGYVDSADLFDFLEDRKTVDACITQFAHLGETAKNLKEIFGEEEGIPFKEIIGFRNIIAHDYLGISYNVMYGIIEKDLPDLKEVLIKKLYSK